MSIPFFAVRQWSPAVSSVKLCMFRCIMFPQDYPQASFSFSSKVDKMMKLQMTCSRPAAFHNPQSVTPQSMRVFHTCLAKEDSCHHGNISEYANKETFSNHRWTVLLNNIIIHRLFCLVFLLNVSKHNKLYNFLSLKCSWRHDHMFINRFQEKKKIMFSLRFLMAIKILNTF